MAHFIRVNEGDFSEIDTVIDTMNTFNDDDDFDFHDLRSEWGNLAEELDIPREALPFMHCLELPAYSTAVALTKVLRKWTKRHSKNATLDKLILALENCDLTSLADKLRNKFYPSNYESRYSRESPDGSTSRQIGSVEYAVAENLPSDTFPSPHLSLRNFTDDDVKSRILRAGSDLGIFVKRNVNSKTKIGYALILNIVKYGNSYRHGSQYDSIRMRQLLIQLGYQILVYDDVNAEYTLLDIQFIINAFKAEIKNLKGISSILVFVGSHGKLDKITLSDRNRIDIYENIVYQFDQDRCPELKETPKIFIFQCCRNPVKTDGEYTNIQKAMICYATLPNNAAYRTEHNGSPFIESLVRIFAEHARNYNLKALMDMVDKDLQKQKIEYDDNCNRVQQSTYESIGQFGDFYFMADQ